jgi:hypothetical protein
MAAKLVYVELVAQTKKFAAGMKKADGALAKVKKSVALVSAAILAIGAIAIRGLIRELGNLSVELDNLAKTAKGLGVSFNFLEDMQFVFKRLGGKGGTEPMKKMFKTLNKATSEAASGSKEYVDVFKDLGVNQNEFIKLKPEAQILALHKAFQNSAKGTKEMAAMGDLLGRGFTANMPVFAATTDEFIELIELRRELGGFTEESGKLGEAYEDVKANIGQVKRALKDEVFKTFAPIMIKMGKATQEFFQWLDKTGLTVPILTTGLTVLVSLMGLAAAAGIALAVAFIPISAVAVAITAAITGMTLAIGTVIYYWDDLLISIRDFGDVAGPILDKITSFGGEVLAVLGFGDDELRARNAAAPTTPGLIGSRGSTTNSSSVVNIDASGMTPEQVNRLIKEHQAQAASGKNR